MADLDRIEIRIPRRPLDSSQHRDSHFFAEEHKQLLSHTQYLIDACIQGKHRVVSLNSTSQGPASTGQEYVIDRSNSEAETRVDVEHDQTTDGLYSLGEGALESIISPPYRTPSRSQNELESDVAVRPRDSSSKIHPKPWSTFQPISNSSQTDSYDLRHVKSPHVGHRRGFWLIPVWTVNLEPTDLYTIYRNKISLPYWTDPRIPRHPQITKSTIVWDPERLKAFWSLMRHVCEKKLLARNLVTLAIIASHSLVPDSRPKDHCKVQGDGLGDHIRVWCDAQCALAVRRFISDISVSMALKVLAAKDAHRDTQSNHSVSLSGSEQWLKHCVFMWFDETGLARGYG